MAIRLPENLAPENYPMGWLVDSWHGGGVLEYEGVDAAAYLHELTIDASDGGPYLKITSNVWLANEPAGIVDKEAPGQVTYDQLTKAELWSTHTGFVRVNPESEQRPDGSSELEAMLVTPAGLAHAWVGLINGPRFQLVIDGVMRSASGAQVDGARILGGSVGSELFYAIDMEAFGSDMRSYMAGRMSRQFDDAVDPVVNDAVSDDAGAGPAAGQTAAGQPGADQPAADQVSP
ncbi:MAG: FABP family protein [Actinomycetaceae bacterium]|nr:FABP family protein [Actinomycetaceae bacterium]